MSDKEEHSKWHALLQPIRDLEKNWDVDIAGELTDYLEELSQITFEVDGICNLDFAEAAYIVHGSSCTYGKKVEHLLKLTVSALENVRQQRQKKVAGKRRKISDEDYARQLGVVDILPIVVKGNLQKCEENALSQLRAPEVQPALLHDVLMAESCPVVAHVVDSGKPQLVDTLASGPSDAPTFNVIRCHSHASGAFFVLRADGEAFDAHMRPVHRSNVYCLPEADRQIDRTERIVVDAFGSPVDHLDPLNIDPAALPPVTAVKESRAQTEEEGLVVDGNQKFGSPAGMFVDVPDIQDRMNIDQDVPEPFNQQPVDDEHTDEIYDDDETDTDDGGWLVVDPHDTSQNQDKPFRVHRPCIPKLKSDMKLCTWQPFILPELHAAAEERLQLLLPGWGPAKSAIRAAAVLSEPVGAQRPGPALDALGLYPGESITLCDQKLLDDPVGHPWMEEHDGGIDGCAYDDVGDDNAERDWHGMDSGAVAESAEEETLGPLPRSALTYDQLVEQYSQAVVAATNNAAAHQLESRKVRNWKSTIRKAMYEQLERPDFDVQKTGEQIVRKAGVLARTIENQLRFEDIVQCEHKYEVARCFSAFLQQVNNNAVDLVRGNTPADPFFVKLCG